MKSWLAALAVLFLAGLFAILYFPSRKTAVNPAASARFLSPGEPSRTEATEATDNSPASSGQTSSRGAVPDPRPVATAGLGAVAPKPAASPVPPTAESASLPPETVLENMRTLIRLYGSMFDGNPVGNNAEITKALQGDNPKHINFLKPDDGNRVNAAGELVDVWGTPYFFHQLSGTEMEIRSAGPDRQMWTDDDLVIR